jgi:hypothetical protein
LEGVVSGLILNGTPTMRDTLLSQADAELLREYKKFLVKYGMRESLWCSKCEAEGRPAGLKAYVTDSKIDFECRCTVRRYRGQTY